MFLFQTVPEKEAPLPSSKPQDEGIWKQDVKYLIYLNDEDTMSRGAKHGLILRLEPEQYKKLIEQSSGFGGFNETEFIKNAKRMLDDPSNDHKWLAEPVKVFKHGEVIIQHDYGQKAMEEYDLRGPAWYRFPQKQPADKVYELMMDPAKKPAWDIRGNRGGMCPCKLELEPPLAKKDSGERKPTRTLSA